MEKGIVKWFSVRKGYGFIQKENGDDIFVHFSNIRGNEKILFEGNEVQFEIGAGRDGKEQAIDLKVVEK